MGLAGPRKRTKISHDPNNTQWSRSTNGFGHKIMTSHGWAPGDYLGASNNAREDTYTAASAGHIRVILKDDNLGLGARPRRLLQDEEAPGLDAFQGILGRLNGVSEVQLAAEQKIVEDKKMIRYMQSRWACMTFVPGGRLVPDKVSKIIRKDKDDLNDNNNADTDVLVDSKKRKRNETDDEKKLRKKEKLERKKEKMERRERRREKKEKKEKKREKKEKEKKEKLKKTKTENKE
ncbi:telomerase inhibitor [Myotisia sp. PD_48]|nr:telomerase inhibitor [Myotisia sp. PD_48]